MIRITGGHFRGRTIETPPNNKVRPTTALVRESVFNHLQQYLPGSRFLDLFAGTGLMGIEALSRGAKYVFAVEKNRLNCQLILKNYQKLGLEKETACLTCQDVMKLASQPCSQAPFDLLYIDPPYGTQHLNELVEMLLLHRWATPQGIILVEQGSRDIPLTGFELRSYGDTVVWTRRLDLALP